MENKRIKLGLEDIRDFYAWNPKEYEVLDEAIKVLQKLEREKWHPVNADDPDSFPNDERLVMVSFENAPGAIDIARFRADDEGGAFYPGDEEYTYSEHDMYVSAWKEAPESYENVMRNMEAD